MSAYATSFLLPPAAAGPSVSFDSSSTASSSVYSSSCSGSSSASTAASADTSCVTSPLLVDEHATNAPSTNTNNRQRVPDIFISVKSASVDPAGFVRSIARGANRRQRRVRTSSVPTTKDSNNNSSGSKLPPRSAPPARRRADSDCSKDSSSSLHDEAIQFELSISYAGRKYSATRTLNRLVRLRDELVRELRDRAPGIPSTRGGGRREGGDQYSSDGYDNDDDTAGSTLPEHFDMSERSSHSSPSKRSAGDSERHDHQAASLPPVVLIPELPVAGADHTSDLVNTSSPSSSSSTRAGPCSGSFTRLSMALKSYCPAVENWFTRIVTDVLPDPESSPSLTAFLWEPIGSTDNNTDANSNVKKKAGEHQNHHLGKGGNRHSSSKSMWTLGSIEEQEDGQDDEEEEEEEEEKDS